MRTTRVFSAWLVFLATVAAAACLGGCVEREMKITSEPSGALVYLSQEPIGRTPVTKTFLWYGCYDIVLRYEEKGYETLKTHRTLTPPIYEIPPLDLFSAMAPWTYHDRRHLHFTMQKLKPATDEELIKRAQEMQKRNLAPVDR